MGPLPVKPAIRLVNIGRVTGEPDAYSFSWRGLYWPFRESSVIAVLRNTTHTLIIRTDFRDFVASYRLVNCLAHCGSDGRLLAAATLAAGFALL